MTERVRLHPPKTAKTHRERLEPPKPKRAKRRAMQLTEAKVAALRVDKAGPYLMWDHGNDSQKGLAVMVQPSGVKTFTAFYNFPKQPSKSMALGRAGEMTLEAARKRTGEVRAKAKQGIDPRADDPTRSLTFGELVAEWHTKELTGRKKNVSADEVKGLVLHHTQHWANRPAATIRKAEIIDLLEGISQGTRKLAKGKRARPQGPTANRLHAHLGTLFSWALRRELAGFTKSPMVGVDLPDPEATKPRQRTWFAGKAADAVVAALWGLARELGGVSEKFLKLLILTGKRRAAIMTMRWEHIDDTWYWQPPSTSDNKRTTPIPLPALAQRVLGKRPQGGGPVMRVSEATAQELIRTVRKRLGIADFLLHGLRHIAETRMGELGVLPHVRDLLLDHAIARSATGAGYDHGAYKAQLLEALELWADHIERLVSPGEGVAVLR